MNLRKLGIISGVLAPVIWLSLIATAGLMRPEFSHVTDYISELGESGGATEALMRHAGFEFTGLLYLCFAAALPATLRAGPLSVLAAGLVALDGLGRIGAGIFPCDPGCDGTSLSQELHHLFATIGFLSGILAAVVWGIVFRRQGWPQGWTGYSIGSGIAALIFLMLMSWGQQIANTPGLFEHLATGALSLWLLAFAMRLLRL